MTAMYESTRSEGSDENLVAPGDGCPECGERDADALVWNEDGTAVDCRSCGATYHPPEA